MSSTIIGGPHKCSSTGFTTEDEQQWIQHCLEHQTHKITGTTACITCNKSIELNHIPISDLTINGQVRYDQLKCVECLDKIEDTNRKILQNIQGKQNQKPVIKEGGKVI